MAGITNVHGTATDDVGATQCRNSKVYTGSAAPYTYNWNTKKASSGAHVITANARDGAGNMGSATPVTVTKK